MSRGAPMPLPSQPSLIDAQLQNADWFAAAGQIGPALGLYRTAAQTAEAQGLGQRALAIHARIARLDADPAVRLRIAALQLQLGQADVAAATADGVVKDELRLQRVPQAMAAARLAVAAEPTESRRLLLADLAARMGTHADAADQLAIVAQVELAAGRHARAQSLCGRALRLSPQHVPSLRVAVDAHLRARDIHRAVAAIRTILALLPHDEQAAEGMANAFVLLGKPDRAAEVLHLLALRLADAGPDASASARAAVRRALAWQPQHAGLQALDRRLAQPASTPVQAQGDDATRVIDLRDLVEVGRASPPAPARAPARPMRRTGPYALRSSAPT